MEVHGAYCFVQLCLLLSIDMLLDGARRHSWRQRRRGCCTQCREWLLGQHQPMRMLPRQRLC